MKTKIVLLLFTFVFCQGVFAQTDNNHGLILRGTAYDGKFEYNNGYAIWKAKLRMEFVNTGSKPIILINPFAEYGSWKSKVEFIGKDKVCKKLNHQVICIKWSFEKVVFSKHIKKVNAKTQRLKELAEGLDSEVPPQNLTTIIDAGNSLQFDDEIEIKQKVTASKNKENGYWITIWEGNYGCSKGSSCGLKVSEYPEIKIKYETSLIKYQKTPDLLENSQVKWKRFGILPIDMKGSFTITSESIKNIRYRGDNH